MSARMALRPFVCSLWMSDMIVSSETANCSRPLLSVAIATRNRAEYIRRSLEQLVNYFDRLDFTDYEIVVSNNHSSDSTESIVSGIAQDQPGIRLIRPADPMDTAEKHFDFAIGACKGEFVWTLGDDDILVDSGIEMLVSILRATETDVLIFNTGGISSDGVLFTKHKYSLLSLYYSEKFRDLVCHIGLTYILPGYSSIIFRRAKYSSEVFHSFFSISQIYSCVFTLVDCFNDSTAAMVDVPLVLYRRNLYAEKPTDHWTNYTKKHGLFDAFPWTLGIVRSLECLVGARKFELRKMSSIIDHTDTNRYIWYLDLVVKLMGQVVDDFHSVTKVKISLAQFEECLMFIEKIIPEEWDVIFALRRMKSYIGLTRRERGARKELQALVAQVHRCMNARTTTISNRYKVIESPQYSLYNHAGDYFVVPSYFDPFQYIDYRNSPLVRIVSLVEAVKIMDEDRRREPQISKKNPESSSASDMAVYNVLQGLNNKLDLILGWIEKIFALHSKKFFGQISRLLYAISWRIVPRAVKDRLHKFMIK